MIDFRSDNTGRAAPEILDALVRANHDTALGYGADAWTAELQQRFSDLFETAVRVFPVATGTAANALALASLGPSWGIVYCSEVAHINTSEANAAGFFGGGIKLVAIGGMHGKIDADLLAEGLAAIAPGQLHKGQPSAVSLTQATDLGAVYSIDEVRNVAETVKRRRLRLHMDGARFANAVARLGFAPADATWRSGIDIMSFGATKNGGALCDAIVVFSSELADGVAVQLRRAGQVWSKMRFASAQLIAYVENGLWLEMARASNEMNTVKVNLPDSGDCKLRRSKMSVSGKLSAVTRTLRQSPSFLVFCTFSRCTSSPLPRQWRVVTSLVRPHVFASS